MLRFVITVADNGSVLFPLARYEHNKDERSEDAANDSLFWTKNCLIFLHLKNDWIWKLAGKFERPRVQSTAPQGPKR